VQLTAERILCANIYEAANISRKIPQYKGRGVSMVTTLGNQVVYLPVDKISQNPYQPRKYFDLAGLNELAKSIKTYGVMQPISVRCINGVNYELVAGERRLRASKIAGVETIPAVIMYITDQTSAVLALIENLQREDLNYIEEAEGYVNLISDYALTQEQLAAKIGKSQSAIANKMRILKLSRQVQKILIENGLSERHARALLKLGDENLQLEVLEKVLESGLTVKKTEELVETVLRIGSTEVKGRMTAKRKRHFQPRVKDLRLFTNTIQQAVDIMNDSGVNTVFDIENNDDGCFIKILVKY